MPFKFMIEVYVDDYINLAMGRSKRDLDNISNATMHGMHSMFSTNKVDSKDPISEKKIIKKDGQWRIEKDVLGWTFEGVEKIVVLEEDKIEAVLAKLKEWSRSKRGISFADFHKHVSKVQQTSKGIPAVKALFTPVNKVSLFQRV